MLTVPKIMILCVILSHSILPCRGFVMLGTFLFGLIFYIVCLVLFSIHIFRVSSYHMHLRLCEYHEMGNFQAIQFFVE